VTGTGGGSISTAEAAVAVAFVLLTAWLLFRFRDEPGRRRRVQATAAVVGFAAVAYVAVRSLTS
jgi:peptidoglycan/LPS O-acetylase OafA/YrhL